MAFTLDPYACKGLLSNPNITEEVIDTLLSSRPNKWILDAIAKSKKATPAQLEVVYKKSKSFEVLAGLAGNPKTPVHILETLFCKEVHKYTILGNEQIPQQLISSFLKTKLKIKASTLYPKFRALASNPALSDKNDQFVLAKRMLAGEGEWVVDYLFSNPNLHSEVFEYLWNSGVRVGPVGISSKYFSEKHTKVILSYDDDTWETERTKCHILEAQYCPKDIVLKARKDGSELEREAAFSNPTVPIDYANIDYTDLAAISGMVRRDDVPENLLIKIAELETPPTDNETANDFYYEIKGVLALKNVPSVLELLFSQGTVEPSNPNLSEAMLEYCITKGSHFDRWFALRNPKISLAKIKSYLGLEEKQSDVSKAKPIYELPDWYRQLVNAIDQFDYKEEVWTENPIPRIFLPELTDTLGPKDEIIGVIGGYFYQSDLGDQRIKEGDAQPTIQIDLRALSKKTGINFGDGILQVWTGGEIDLVDRDAIFARSEECCINVPLPENLKDASQFDQAYAGFDWTESYYVDCLGLRPPFFITGIVDAGLNIRSINPQQSKVLIEKLNNVNLDKAEIEEYYEKNSRALNGRSHWEHEVLGSAIALQKYLDISFGNFREWNFAELLSDTDDEFDYDQFEDEGVSVGRGRWIPLMNLKGTQHDVIEDVYTIFYCKTTNDGFKYEVRWMWR